MIKKLFILSLLTVTPVSSFADCELPKGEVLKVGCSYGCDFFYRNSIRLLSWVKGYKTQIVDLTVQPNLPKALSEVDGVLIPGGVDIDPKYYLDKISPELREYTQKNLHLVNFSKEGEKRDPFEYALLKMYSENNEYKDLPLLGVCRGMQMMSVAQGIPLWLDIKTEVGIKNRRNLYDRIFVEKEESRMTEIYGKKSFRAFKLHHQGIRVPYYQENQSQFPNTRVTAYSNKGRIAESIEYTHRPAIGVQYHPERFSIRSVPVINWFLEKSCEYKTSQKDNL